MDTEQYGIVTNYISWQNILLIIATLNLLFLEYFLKTSTSLAD